MKKAAIMVVIAISLLAGVSLFMKYKTRSPFKADVQMSW